MELVNLQESWGKSTYLSQILEAEDTSGKRYVVKRNKGKLTENQYRFFQWLNEKKPDGLLVPVEFTGNVGERWEEVYEFIDWPLLDNVLLELFPVDDELKGGWNFSYALRIMEQTTSILGVLNSEGFIHHDVRAKNLFVNPNGLEVKLFDYNSLREPYFLDHGEDSWNDVPPEYKQGNCTIDFRFDVYQAGRLFYAMTHGYTRDYFRKVPRVELPDGVLEIIAKSSHEEQEGRYSDCNEFHKAICALESS